ncbi:DUF3772 domain-containing protein [Phreatobacter cathodiphilus]|uniref:DUF3772 domain-containing protein n=1 Tax=Phreatobacter cathodiphilus TaxID=1868589 RepID=UPI0011B29F54|nr:DUF3772 domain-containing protein [Phreatobacter cathodiphilus]
MRRLLPLFLTLALALAAAAPLALRAETITVEESQKVAEARRIIAEVERDQEAQAENFAGLLDLREKIEPVRDTLREIVGALQQRLTAENAQLSELGPAPAAGAPAEAADVAASRRQKQDTVGEIERHLRATRALLVQAEQIWGEINEARRELFTSRIFAHQNSILYPRFWRQLVEISLPNLRARLGFKAEELSRGMSRGDAWPVIGGLAGLSLVTAGLLTWARRRFERFRASAIAGGEEAPSKARIVALAYLVLAMRALPYLAVSLLIWIAVARFDVGPEDIQTFLLGLAGAVLVYGLATGATHAVFSPRHAAYRVLKTDDGTAGRSVLFLDVVLATYLVGLVMLGVVQLAETHLSVTVAVTALVSLWVTVTGAALLLRYKPRFADPPVSGLIALPLHLMRPFFWVLALVIIGSLLMGFIALSGFVVGRTLATAIILCLAVLIYVAIDTVFYDAVAPGAKANATLSSAFGVRPATVDLAGTVIGGMLRVATVLFTILVLFSPWGLEFGNLNPFEDVFFGVRFGEVRGWLGAAGIAVILFSAGLLVTRLFVSWLDGQLLPRTGLNDGVRHSVTTVAGYAGFLVAMTVALAVAGVQLQNVALVAGALSVGIGFGLQQVVQNFVAGLIVLAERPIRVGDTIVVKGEEGKVTKISVRATELTLGENSTVIVPNSDIVSSIVKNRSLVDATHRATVRLSVARDSDLDSVFDILRRAGEEHANVLKTSAPSVSIVRVSEVGIDFDLSVLCDRVSNLDRVRSDLYRAILTAFRAAGIGLAEARTIVIPSGPSS